MLKKLLPLLILIFLFSFSIKEVQATPWSFLNNLSSTAPNELNALDFYYTTASPPLLRLTTTGILRTKIITDLDDATNTYKVDPASTSTFNQINSDGINNSGTVYSSNFRARGSNGALIFEDRANPANHFIWYTSGNIARLWHNTFGEIIAANSSGNVGIGTIAPAVKLDLVGSQQISPQVSSYLKFSSNSPSDANDGKIGAGLFLPGLNIVGIKTDGTYRKLTIFGEISQWENGGTNTWKGTNNFSGNVNTTGTATFTGNGTTQFGTAAPYANWIRGQTVAFNDKWVDENDAATYYLDPSWYSKFNVLTVSQFTNLSASDARLKTNIKPIPDSLYKIKSINGVTFNWKPGVPVPANPSKSIQVGVIAQDVEKVLPELVSIDEKGYKTVEYIKLIPVLIEAVKEQQVQIEELRKEVDLLKNP